MVSSQKRKQKINKYRLIYIFKKTLRMKSACRSESSGGRANAKIIKVKIKLHLDNKVITQLNEHTHSSSQG